MAKEYRVGTIGNRELADIGLAGTDLAWVFWEHGWQGHDDIHSGRSAPSWNEIASEVPSGTWLLSSVYDSVEDSFSLELLARKPDGHLYVLNEDHLAEIVNQKYPARAGEDPFEHFERALSHWVETDDMEFAGDMFANVCDADADDCLDDVSDGDGDGRETDVDPDLSGLEVAEPWTPPTRKS
jgi:hypothetical protein